MLKLKAKPGFNAVPAALVLRDKAGLRLSEAKKVVDDLSEGGSVTVSVRLASGEGRGRVDEIAEALRGCRVAVEDEPVAARA